MSLLLLGKLLLFAFAGWSLPTYYSGRKDEKSRLQDMASSHRAIRTLSTDEVAALQPLPGMPPTPGNPL